VETVRCQNIELEYFCKFLSISETIKLEKEKKTSRGKPITASPGRYKYTVITRDRFEDMYDLEECKETRYV